MMVLVHEKVCVHMIVKLKVLSTIYLGVCYRFLCIRPALDAWMYVYLGVCYRFLCIRPALDA